MRIEDGRAAAALTVLARPVTAAELQCSGGHLELGRAPTGGLRAIAVLPTAD
ncbi:hypothetical protein [Streptomyces sp. C10]|uniref:hypothetical protein n=1 Tax=Streptomyces sp. C10 TaxID=531941 RepID=UPI00397F084D